MQYFPIFLDLNNQPVLIVGGGEVAERKALLLLKAGARVQVVARSFSDKMNRMQLEGRIEWLGRTYSEKHLTGARLAFAATNEQVLNSQVKQDAERLNIPVNVVDDLKQCRFIMPAIVDRSPIQIAISSAGTSPVLARRIRAWIEQLLPTGIGKIARAAGQLRSKARQYPLSQRRRFWDRALSRQNILAWSELPFTSIKKMLKQSLNQDAPRPGKVYLVGAGPGRADLLTLRALQLLGQADVILHDKLVPDAIMDKARRDAEFIDVGKRSGCHQKTQEQIHQLMKEHAGAGKQVVRLKGGDAFIFGRGGEELECLHELGIDYEVVPGITAATACAAYAGIPLTHREHAHALTLLTGHTPEGGREPAWNELVGEGRTLGIYMGVKQAGNLKEKLLNAGLDGDLPVALIADGTRDTQQVEHGKVSELPAMARRLSAGAPGLFIIGSVASLGRKLAWFDGANVLEEAA